MEASQAKLDGQLVKKVKLISSEGFLATQEKGVRNGISDRLA